MEELRALADDKNIRDPRKLYQYARSKGQDVTAKQAAEALRTSTARQLLAPPTRPQGHFAASGPGSAIQEDLIDLGHRSKKKGQPNFALVGVDVYTRKLAVEPLYNKKAETVYNINGDLLEKLGAKDNAVITTDKGGEWADVSKHYDDHIHVSKDSRDTNGIAIVDSGIRNIKRDLAQELGKERGRKWQDHIEQVVDDLNDKPHPALFGNAPDKVTENPILDFKVLQRNADNFALNDRNAQKQMLAVNEAGAFKAPADNGGRSFKPTFGPTQKLEGLDSQYVRSKGWLAALKRGESGEDHEYLLKQVRPAYGDNGKFLSQLTADVAKTKIGPKAKPLLKNQALQLENILHSEGAISTESLLQRITGLRKLTQKYRNLTPENWISKTFGKKFAVEGGQVRLKKPAPPVAPEPPRSTMLRGVKSAPAAVQPAKAPVRGLVKGGGRKAVEMLRQAPPVPPVPPPVAPLAPPKKKDKNYFLGLRAMYG